MGFGSLLDNAKNRAAQAVNGRVEQVVSENLERIQQLFKTKAGGLIKGIVEDDGKMAEVSRFVYGELPLPVRLVVKEDDFVSFCLKNRDKVLANPSS